MTRIIAGQWKGRTLKVPRTVTRPTSSRVREALFSAVEHSTGGFANLRVLDLFAGSGALGLEAVSRGAVSAVLVEHDRRAADTARANVHELQASNITVVGDEVLRYLRTAAPTVFQVILADPPYSIADSVVTEMLALLISRDWLAPGGAIVVERSVKSHLEWPAGYEGARVREYGDTAIHSATRITASC